MDEILWTLERVRLGAGSRPRLRDITLTVRAGITAVLGPSGAGKTSLLDLLVGFERPDAGRLAASLRPGARLAASLKPGSACAASLPLYWVPQQAGLWPHLTAREHLEAVAAAGVGGDAIERLLNEFDMAHRASARPDELSAGERARLSVARALAAAPSVLVMDEPLAHVDLTGGDRYWRVVRRLAAESGASLVFSTHLPQMVLGEAERVICLREGAVVFEGEVEELYQRPPTREAAECLGEANWMEPQEAELWLGAADRLAGGDRLTGPGPHHEVRLQRRCYRPERIALSPAQDGPFVVRDHRAKGVVAETELLHEPSGRCRRFFHAPPRRPVRPGDRARLTVLGVLLCAIAMLLSAGCGGDREPELNVKDWRVWSMPRDGASLPTPRSLTVGTDGEVVVLDDAGRVVVFDSGGVVKRWWRMPETASGNPEDALVLKDGRIVVCDTHYHRVIIFSPEGEVVGQFGTYGRGPGQFIYPVGIAADADENLYVCEYGGNDRVQKFRPDGTFVKAFGSFGTDPGQFQRPSGMAWHDGRLYVADAINNRIQVFTDEGRFVGILGGHGGAPRLDMPYDIALGGDGDLYTIEYGAGRVTRLSLAGKVLGRYGRMGRGEHELRTPWGIAVDRATNRIRIADTGNRRIVELRP